MAAVAMSLPAFASAGLQASFQVFRRDNGEVEVTVILENTGDQPVEVVTDYGIHVTANENLPLQRVAPHDLPVTRAAPPRVWRAVLPGTKFPAGRFFGDLAQGEATLTVTVQTRQGPKTLRTAGVVIP